MGNIAQITREQHEALKRGELVPAAPQLPSSDPYYDAAPVIEPELVPEALETGPDSPAPKRNTPPWARRPRPTVGIA
jgi:hypothetical protein